MSDGQWRILTFMSGESCRTEAGKHGPVPKVIRTAPPREAVLTSSTAILLCLLILL